MSDSVIIALLSLVGTILGSGLGVVASQKLTQYRPSGWCCYMTNCVIKERNMT